MDDQRTNRERIRRMKFMIFARLFAAGLFIYGAVLQFTEEDRPALGIGFIILTAIVLFNTWKRYKRLQDEKNLNPTA